MTVASTDFAPCASPVWTEFRLVSSKLPTLIPRLGQQLVPELRPHNQAQPVPVAAFAQKQHKLQVSNRP
ncbi:hypothetical protein PoB_002679600 [Plakobranchus ocellatus]|uniref:Uncharacterized protein n=1 Tax=Plakobranchus ocellatus TaxID=259542 RepID=A0AAV3ZWJ2_9GAST|nr:hypothetical protein PoB_002679600 [Plakobranchus ocellatus]